MVKAKTPWHSLQCSPGKLPDLKCMSALLETRQHVCLPSLKEVRSFEFLGSSDPRPPSSRTEPRNEARFSAQSPKGFLVFDRSGDQTRMIFNYLCPSVPNPENQTANNERPYKESYDTNGESEMHEDTEEINALLDSEDDESDGSDDDDEVTSTCRSPTPTKRVHEKDEPIEGVASSDGPNKRQKKLDGSHHEYDNDGGDDDDDVKSSYDDGPSGFEGSKKDKIRRILRILESIIPGVKGKDPLLVIDEAIDYLSVAKIKAETLGVSSH